MRHVGDITKLNGAELPVVDVITGGSPCQDLSIAGARAGLAGERSGLFMEQIRVVKEMRDEDRRTGRTGWNVRPRYMVWENVPGAFSSNRGKDFGAVLTEIVRIVCKEVPDVPVPDKGWPKSGCISGVGDDGTGFSVCYRLHDAQFWGVPQRRKRIALVADFGGLSAPEILFERKGMRWDTPQSGASGQDSAARAGAGASGAISFQERSGKPGGGKGILIQDEHTGALSTLNNQSVCYGISAFDSNAMKSPNPNSGIYKADTSRTLDLNGGSPACNQGGIAVVQVLNDQGGSVMGTSEDVSGALRAEEHGHQPILYDVRITSDGTKNARAHCYPTETCRCLDQACDNPDSNHGGVAIIESGCNWDGSQVVGTLTKNNANGAQRMPDKDNFNAVITYGLDRASYNQGYDAQFSFTVLEDAAPTQTSMGPGAVSTNVVRRLTPMECERLQGFPDGWTDIGPWYDQKGKLHKESTDSARYKALGNSIALPF